MSHFGRFCIIPVSVLPEPFLDRFCAAPEMLLGRSMAEVLGEITFYFVLKQYGSADSSKAIAVPGGAGEVFGNVAVQPNDVNVAVTSAAATTGSTVTSLVTLIHAAHYICTLPNNIEVHVRY